MSSEDSIGHISFDIEATGQNIFDDVMFSIGFATSDGTSGKISLDLGKPEHVPWNEWWIRNKWEMRCYYEFWSKHEDMLDKLQNPEFVQIVSTKQAMMDWVVERMLGFEAKHTTVVPWFDTTCFDSVWISYYMMDMGYNSMMYRRDGKGMMWAREISSYFMGSMRFTPSTPYSEVSKWKRSMEKNDLFGNWSTDNAHCPESDAQGIMNLVMSTIDLNNERYP